VVKLRKQSGRNAGSEETHGSIAENVEKAIPRQIYPRLQVIVAMFVEANLYLTDRNWMFTAQY
jgi:hypothetical protein